MMGSFLRRCRWPCQRGDITVVDELELSPWSKWTKCVSPTEHTQPSTQTKTQETVTHSLLTLLPRLQVSTVPLEVGATLGACCCHEHTCTAVLQCGTLPRPPSHSTKSSAPDTPFAPLPARPALPLLPATAWHNHQQPGLQLCSHSVPSRLLALQRRCCQFSLRRLPHI